MDDYNIPYCVAYPYYTKQYQQKRVEKHKKHKDVCDAWRKREIDWNTYCKLEKRYRV